MYTLDPLAEHNRRAAIRAWNKRRVANIYAQVTAADVLTRHGVTLHYGGAQSEQISCPFHGDDRRPSAKYNPEESDRPSCVWCFVCHERWDVLSLWKKYTGTEKFGDLLREIERAFGLTTPEANEIPEIEVPPDPLIEQVQQLFETAERRLREYRDCFSLETHLKLGQIVDHIAFHLERKQITHAVAKERLAAVHAKIKQSRISSAAPLADP